MKIFADSISILTTISLIGVGCASAPTAGDAQPKDSPAPAAASTPSAPSGGASVKEADTQPPCEDGDDGCRERRVETTMGWLGLGLSGSEVTTTLGVPLTNKDEGLMEATGEYLFVWSWLERGIEIDMVGPKHDGALEVGGFTVRAPFGPKTERGVGVGSSEADVRAAYAGLGDPRFDEPGAQFIAGSIYGGIHFTFMDGKVASVFVGAGAE